MSISRYRTIQSLILPAMPKAANANYLRPKSDKQWTRKLTWTTNSRIRDEFFYPLCFYTIMVKIYKMTIPFWDNKYLVFTGCPKWAETGFCWLWFRVFHCLPNSAWADGNLAEAAGQLGKMVEHRNQSQPNPGLSSLGTPCISIN